MVLPGPLVEVVSSHPSVPLFTTTVARPMTAWTSVGEQKRLARCRWPILTGPRQGSQREEKAPSTEAQALRKLGLEKGDQFRHGSSKRHVVGEALLSLWGWHL